MLIRSWKIGISKTMQGEKLLKRILNELCFFTHLRPDERLERRASFPANSRDNSTSAALSAWQEDSV